VPTLDGLGAVGAGAHSLDEAVRIDTLPVRAAWLARTIRRVAADHAGVSSAAASLSSPQPDDLVGPTRSATR
jgi:hypothetical protein